MCIQHADSTDEPFPHRTLMQTPICDAHQPCMYGACTTSLYRGLTETRHRRMCTLTFVCVCVCVCVRVCVRVSRLVLSLHCSMRGRSCHGYNVHRQTNRPGPSNYEHSVKTCRSKCESGHACTMALSTHLAWLMQQRFRSQRRRLHACVPFGVLPRWSADVVAVVSASTAACRVHTQAAPGCPRPCDRAGTW